MMALARFTGPIELTDGFQPRPGLRHVLMDWDGTISLLRAGWVEAMVDVCLTGMPSLDRATVHAEMLAMNGKPSIHQMTRMAELIGAAGGSAQHPDEYQAQYLERITRIVSDRMEAVRGGLPAHEVMVPGVRTMLDALMARGLDLSLASGTPQPELLVESALLKVSAVFAGRIHGPRDTTDRSFSKRAAIHQLVEEHGFNGSELLGIGDGPVEIGEVKAMGGLTVGVAGRDAEPGADGFDRFKRQQLLEAGADLLVADFRDADALVDLLLGS